jgi:DeoR family glycerol-3-phosphate regulon repressor
MTTETQPNPSDTQLTLRQKQICDLVGARGFLTVESLASHFHITPQTVRKELNYLASCALVQRFHGGAGAPSSVENAAYVTRQVLHLPEKQRIARLVADHIPERASIFINIGTTTEEIARYIIHRKGLRVITNNLHVANILADSPDIDVIIAGGQVRRQDHGIVGELTVEFINQFKVDIGIIGISGIDADGSLLDFDYREVLVARSIIANSRRVMLAADASKFGRSAMVRVGHMAEVDELFTDREPPADFRDMLVASDVKVHVAAPA